MARLLGNAVAVDRSALSRPASSRLVRLSDLPAGVSDALQRPAQPGEVEALKAQIAARRGEQSPPPGATESEEVPAHLRHSILTPAERQQEIDDSSRYQTLDEQIDEWLDEYGGTIPQDVLTDMVRRHRADLAARMTSG
ncbi:hypothetical protein [Williamsia sp. Leaf354]|uniref:hypothetical protein n=1 Tax=Williamsia sp. Leaf354 TaxID=1736349 RepID=UPI0006F75EA5|nr:hypothetical protein [Williamsia sp. Leaf354]